jgi:hypothetical protein
MASHWRLNMISVRPNRSRTMVLPLPVDRKRSRPAAERAPEQHSGELFPPSLFRGPQLSARK